MINQSTLIMMDFETGSRFPASTQPIQLAAVAINPRTLEIIPGSEFESLICPIEDKEVLEKYKLDAIEDEALKVNGKNIEELRKAPNLANVWRQFTQYVNNFNYKGGRWDAPICCGFNNNKFDDVITSRICGSEPWKFGPWDDARQEPKLFHPFINIDLSKIAFSWLENNPDIRFLSMDALLDYFGMDKTGAHDALVDVKNQAQILIKFLKLHRHFGKKVLWNSKSTT